MALKTVIDIELARINDTYSGPSYHAIQNIIRSIDVIISPFYEGRNSNKTNIQPFREFFNHGWATLLKRYYDLIDLSVYQPFPLMNEALIDWSYSNILHNGKIEFCKQLLAYEKAGLIKILNPHHNEYTFTYLHENVGLERFDIKSHNFYKEKIVEQFISEKKNKKSFDEKRIKSELRKIIKNPMGKLISYETTPELDEYYDCEGHYFVLRLQGYDDFDTKDEFGSIPYWKYVDLIERVVGVAIKHTSACLELKDMNPKVDLHNILTYTSAKDKTIQDFADYINCPYEEMEQIFSCITLSKDNFDYYLEYPATPPPMYFQVSKNLLIRSIAGCLSNPFSLLNRELKRKYKKDYDRAVNNREERFRKELFYLFPQDRIVKVPNEVNISFEGVKTDIDAVVYDTATGTLGLFQLKWQDPFARSMKERFSRMSNLFPKANEWISKIKFWLNNNTATTIMHSLQVNKFYSDEMPINKICVFVISRNTINFTGIENDDSVAWSTWYQLIESQAKVKTTFDDPIREMFIKIKTLSPQNRLKIDGLEDIQDFEMRLGDTKIYYTSTRKRNS